jgi:hypothetical protein
MEGKTYLEILAEQDTESRQEFQINPKELLVEHNVFDQEVDGDDHHEEELERQEDFQKFGGSHQAAAELGTLHTTQPKLKSAVEYDKAVKIHVISVDSRFRTNRQEPSFDFLYKLVNQVKNVVSIRLSSVEIPNTWYTFSNYCGNTSFVVTLFSGQTSTITIPEGNYSLVLGLGNTLQTVLTSILNTALPGNSFSVNLNEISRLLTISSTTKFQIDFSQGIFAGRIDNWGLGYNLGFRAANFPDPSKPLQTDYDFVHTGVALPDILGSNYIFLSLNPDWRVVEHNHPDHSNLASFAKIVVDVRKNDVIYDNGSNLITKIYNLKQPANISSFKITLSDEYGQLVYLRGGEVSMTLEVTEIVDSALYESLRN